MSDQSLFSVALLALSIAVNGNTQTNAPTYDDSGILLNNIFNVSNTVVARQGGYGLIKFEGQSDPTDDLKHDGRIRFQDPNTDQLLKYDDQSRIFFPEDVVQQQVHNLYDDNRINGQPLKFEEQNIYGPNDYPDNAAMQDVSQSDVQGGHGVAFQDNNSIDVQRDPDFNQGQGQNMKKKKRRRRKPRLQHLGRPGPVANLGHPAVPGTIHGPNQYPNPVYQPGQFYRPPRRRRPSKALEAISAVTGALTSIALYDDYQCVPRLLCEAAGGGTLGTAGSSGLLQSITGLQPLLTLLAAYNGVSASPLFVFGRAVFLGMTSKANPGTCRYAYPLCPTDPEQLVHYLNNYNGGFFRFFGAPQLSNPQNGQQNVEQFYNQLLSMPGQINPHYQDNYGLYQPSADLYNNYGQSNPNIPDQQNYGLYNNLIHQQNDGVQRPSFNGHQQNYGFNYPYGNQNKYGLNQIRLKNNDDYTNVQNGTIEKRIQNNGPSAVEDNNFSSTDQNSRWLFPERGHLNKNDNSNSYSLRFPEETLTDENVKQIESFREVKRFVFPGIQSNRQYVDNYDYSPITPVFNYSSIRFNAGYANIDTQKGTNYNIDEEGDEIIYVVRGNGDPNYPEIIKVKAGQNL